MSQNLQEAFVDAGGFGTRYFHAGDDDAPPVLLVHDGAWGADGVVAWGAVMHELAAEYRVFAPDLLGFGGSDKVVFLDRSPYSFRTSHLSAFCRELELGAVHAVGTSFGGSLVLQASISGELPMRSATSVGGTGGPWRLDVGKQVLSELVPGRAYIEQVVELLANTTDDLQDQIDARLANSLVPGHYGVMLAPRLVHPDASSPRKPDNYPASLREAVCPVAAIIPSDDRLVEKDWERHLQADAPNVQIHHFEGPHSANLTDPVGLSKLLRSIFQNIS